MPKPKKKEASEDGHKMGKYTGYDLKDGKYYLAPCHVESIDKLGSEKQSVRDLLDSVNSFAQKRFHEINLRQTQWWKNVMEDLGIIKDAKETWYYGDGYFHKS